MAGASPAAFRKSCNWYRCQFTDFRSGAAAAVNGHPKSLQLKEAPLLESVLDFIARRVFRPERLELLREELGAFAPDDAEAPAEELSNLRTEWAKLEKRISRQALEIEATDDREDPVARRATIRIRELSAEQALVETRIAELESAPAPAPPEPAQVEALLLSLPELSAALGSYSAEELLDLFAAFDLQSATTSATTRPRSLSH